MTPESADTLTFTKAVEYMGYHVKTLTGKTAPDDYELTVDIDESAEVMEVVVTDHYDARGLDDAMNVIRRAGGAMSTRENGGLEIIDEYTVDDEHHFLVTVGDAYQNAIEVTTAANRRPQFRETANTVQLVEEQDTKMIPFLLEVTYDAYDDPTTSEDDRGELDAAFWSLFSEWELRQTESEGTRQEFVFAPPTDWFEDDPRVNP